MNRLGWLWRAKYLCQRARQPLGLPRLWRFHTCSPPAVRKTESAERIAKTFPSLPGTFTRLHAKSHRERRLRIEARQPRLELLRRANLSLLRAFR